MKRTKRYYDIYDVSIFDLLRSGGQFPSGSNINEELLVEEYQRGYHDAENKVNLKLDEVISKAMQSKQLNEIDDNKAIHFNEEAEKEAEELHKKFLENLKYKSYTSGYDESEKKGNKVNKRLGDSLMDIYEATADRDINSTLNKLDLGLDVDFAELAGYTEASIPTIRTNDDYEHHPLIRATIDEEMDELLGKEEFENEEFDYPTKTKELKDAITKEKNDITLLENSINNTDEYKEYERLMQKKIEEETRTKGKKDIQVNKANKKLTEFLSSNSVLNDIITQLNERKIRLQSNETQLKEFRNILKERIDKHLKESKSALDMMQEGVPLGKGRYHAPYAYARKINPDVYSPENLIKGIAERVNELQKNYEEIKHQQLFEYEQTKNKLSK